MQQFVLNKVVVGHQFVAGGVTTCYTTGVKFFKVNDFNIFKRIQHMKELNIYLFKEQFSSKKRK